LRDDGVGQLMGEKDPNSSTVVAVAVAQYASGDWPGDRAGKEAMASGGYDPTGTRRRSCAAVYDRGLGASCDVPSPAPVSLCESSRSRR